MFKYFSIHEKTEKYIFDEECFIVNNFQLLKNDSRVLLISASNFYEFIMVSTIWGKKWFWKSTILKQCNTIFVGCSFLCKIYRDFKIKYGRLRFHFDQMIDTKIKADWKICEQLWMKIQTFVVTIHFTNSIICWITRFLVWWREVIVCSNIKKGIDLIPHCRLIQIYSMLIQ